MRVFAWLVAVAIVVASPAANQATYDIAVTMIGEGGEGIYVMRSDGSNVKLLRAESGALLTPAAWSPDGKRIAYPWFDVGPDGAHLLAGSSLINVATGETTEPLPTRVLDTMFAPDGK